MTEQFVNTSQKLILQDKSESKLEYLARLKRIGFLFHGTPDPNIKIFVPRKTNDPSSAWNSDMAVFLTSDFPSAIGFALFGQLKATWSMNTIDNQTTIKMPKQKYDERKSSVGYVYVFKNEGFDHDGNWQYKSHNPIIPIAKVKVTSEDCSKAGVKIEFT